MSVDIEDLELSEAGDYGADNSNGHPPTAVPLRAGPSSAQDDSKPGVVVKEKIPASADNNTATQQTIQKMCQYSREGSQDPAVKHWAQFATARFPAPPGLAKEHGLCWSDFFLLKHALRFTNDEPRLFEVGEPEALDLLIAPAVLVRMESPAEDCDGFAMLTASLLTIQGIKCYFITVACDPSDHSRWSHVFVLAELPNGSRVPIDASKGAFPGWMVPRKHIFRWQAWDMDGRPVDVLPPEQNPLHGYRRRGQGNIVWETLNRGVGFIDPTTGVEIPDIPEPSSIATPPIVPTTPVNWGNIFQTLVGGGVKAYQSSQLPSGYFVDPNTGRLVNAQGGQYVGGPYNPLYGGQSSFSLGSILPILAIGGVLLVAVSALGGRR